MITKEQEFISDLIEEFSEFALDRMEPENGPIEADHFDFLIKSLELFKKMKEQI